MAVHKLIILSILIITLFTLFTIPTMSTTVEQQEPITPTPFSTAYITFEILPTELGDNG
jgi:hypothetical protein